MNPETLEALRGSIAKWRAIVDGTGVDESCENCPLCHMFANRDIDEPCIGCPVFLKTGRIGCNDTPYESWIRISIHDRRANTPEKIAAAQAELDFLISLLPEGVGP